MARDTAAVEAATRASEMAELAEKGQNEQEGANEPIVTLADAEAGRGDA